MAELGDCQVKNAVTGEIVTMKTLWQDRPCVFIFFRRWGCVFCRVLATQVSQMARDLRENNVRLVGIGVEDLGVEDFVRGNFFDGELFIDSNKSLYNKLGFKRFSWVSVLCQLFTSESRSAISKGRNDNLGGNLKGDGLQNGGVLIVDKGGSELFRFKQEGPAEHLPNTQIAKFEYSQMQVPKLLLYPDLDKDTNRSDSWLQ